MAWGPVSGCCSNRFWRAASISLIWLTTKPSRAISRCSSAKVFGGSGMPSGVCTVARRSAAPRLRGGRPAQGWFEVANAQPCQGGLYPVHNPRAFPHQAVALPVRPLGVLFGNRWHARHAAMAPFPTQPPQEPPLEQFGVQPIGLCPAMFPRNRYTRRMDHVRLYPARLEPARQPEAVAAGFEGQRNPRDLFTGPDRLIPPAVQHRKQPFWARLQLLARLTLNTRNDAANQPARLAQLDDGNDRAILVEGDEGPAQVVRLGHRGTPSVNAATKLPFPRRPPHSVSRSHPLTRFRNLGGAGASGSARQDRRRHREAPNRRLFASTFVHVKQRQAFPEIGRQVRRRCGSGAS